MRWLPTRRSLKPLGPMKAFLRQQRVETNPWSFTLFPGVPTGHPRNAGEPEYPHDL